MKNIFELRFAVWGTGKYSTMLMNQLEEYVSICNHVFHINLYDNVKYFIDNDLKKENTLFSGKSIKSFDFFLKDTVNFCVIAVLNRSEICAALEEHNYKIGINYISYDNLIDAYKEEILNRRREIFCSYFITYLEETQNINFESQVGLVENAICHLEKEEEKINYILKYVIMSLLIEKWSVSKNKKTDFQLMCNRFGYASVVAAFYWYYGNNIADISEWFCHNIIVSARSISEKQTIGLVIDQYFGGGIEKTVSLLIRLFVKNGHRVVLITENYEPKKEFELPSEVIRCVITSRMGKAKEKRLHELTECINSNQIDIMCFHSGYTHVSTFYDMLHMKLQNVAVVMEVHSAFLPIIVENKNASKFYPYMYNFADKLIVLSNMDKIFWENLGGDCKYIQNPLEDNSDWNETKLLKQTNTIVWVGRLVQIPKRILDVIPIMKKVAEKIPNVKLKVVGLPTNPRIYNVLVRLIEENKLENNIKLCGYKADIAGIYKEADLVLMTSASESFCNVIMESKIWGIPLVTYELPWLELLKSGEGYIAVKQGDTDAAADAIVNLLINNEMRKQMSVESRKSIESFIKHDVYADWKQVFDDIANGQSKGISVCSEFALIEKMLLSAVYDK